MTASLITLVSFNNTNGFFPQASLIADANGDLFGTTVDGGAYGPGTVFEIVNTGTAAAPIYASTPTTLVSFNFSNGAFPDGSLITDPNGDLFGTASAYGANGHGTVFEIVNTGTAAAPIYASTPTTLVSFNGTDGYRPTGSLIADANGDLFGTTGAGGANGHGTVFEIVNTGTAAAPIYASTPTTLVSFNGTDGDRPTGSLITDANGDLFGTTNLGGANNFGTVFEIVNTGTAAAPIYASAPTTLVSFNDSDGAQPYASLIADANGDLFGTTAYGGAYGYGTVFEIVNTRTAAAPIYASTPTTLVSFNLTDGGGPTGSLIADANGDLFGTTAYGGAYNRGTVFEIAKTASGYASTPTTVITFNGSNGGAPFGDLLADTNGDLFGTAATKAGAYGSVFEITGSGFVTELLPKMLNAIFDPATNITTLSGSAEANSIVSIYDNGSGTNKLIGTVNAAMDGTWSLQANVTGNIIHSYTESSTDTSGHILSSTGVTLFSPPAHKTLVGGTGDDVLIGRPSNTFTGGAGADTFVFNPGLGKETIKDFNAQQHDVIAFDHTLFTNATGEQVINQAHDSNGNAVIVVDATDTVTLIGVTVAQLHASDFAFF